MSNAPMIRLAAARVNAGLTQDDVAAELHVSKQTVVAWEGGTTEPKISQARILSRLFDYPLDLIIFSPAESISN